MNTTMKLSSILSILLSMLSIQLSQQLPMTAELSSKTDHESAMMVNPFLMDDILIDSINGNEDKEDLSIDSDYLQKMAKFSARQMSTKNHQYKLISLDSAEKQSADDDDQSSLYRLKVTLQKFDIDNGHNQHQNTMYCTVEINDNDGDWDMESFGCTLPAPIRIRNRNNNNNHKDITTNTIPEIDSIVKPIERLSSNSIGRQQSILPFIYNRQQSFVNQLPPSPSRSQSQRPVPTFRFEEIRPSYRYYY